MEQPQMQQDIREVVEVYRAPGPNEVTLTYSCPLPAGHPEALPLWEKEPEQGRRPRRGLVIFIAALAVLLAVIGLARLGVHLWHQNHMGPGYSFPTIQTGGEIRIPTWEVEDEVDFALQPIENGTLTPQEIYRRVNPSVVTVLVELGNHTSLGTGVIFTEDGYIMTNYHVVEGGTDCAVVLDIGDVIRAQYVAGDADNDLAILKINGDGLPAAEFGDSDLLTVGDPVYAIGNPLGVELRGTLTDGIVSAINRDVEVQGRTMTLLQTNAALNSGNSGGPLINEYGQVIGINVIKMVSYSDETAYVEGLGFAIPSTSVERLTTDLLRFGSVQPEPRLGISVYQDGVILPDGTVGLEVQSVAADSAADRAGIREGDVVLSACGEPLADSRDLLRVRRHHYAGDDFPVVYWRDGQVTETVLHLFESVETK